MGDGIRSRVEDAAKGFSQETELPPQRWWREWIGYLRANRKYWMIPILLGLLVYGTLITLGGSVVAPFTYTLF
jgi:hypothetical protein